jgi:pyruvate carboxylase
VRVRVADDPAGDALVVEPPGDQAGTEDGVGAERQVLVDGEPRDAALHPLGRGRHVILDHGRRTPVVLEDPVPAPGGATVREVLVDGFRFEIRVESDRLAALRERATRDGGAGAHRGPFEVRAIIPGKVVAVSVAAGDAVAAGGQLLVVEAMKMQNELRAPREGTIGRVAVAVGENLEIGDLLVVID